MTVHAPSAAPSRSNGPGPEARPPDAIGSSERNEAPWARTSTWNSPSPVSSMITGCIVTWRTSLVVATNGPVAWPGEWSWLIAGHERRRIATGDQARILSGSLAVRRGILAVALAEPRAEVAAAGETHRCRDRCDGSCGRGDQVACLGKTSACHEFDRCRAGGFREGLGERGPAHASGPGKRCHRMHGRRL